MIPKKRFLIRTIFRLFLEVGSGHFSFNHALNTSKTSQYSNSKFSMQILPRKQQKSCLKNKKNSLVNYAPKSVGRHHDCQKIWSDFTFVCHFGSFGQLLIGFWPKRHMFYALSFVDGTIKFEAFFRLTGQN